ncbi:MAG: WD40 repeat domain-containing protein, partial [Myxococcota bacterium]
MRKRLLPLIALTAAASTSFWFVSPADAVSTRHFTLDNAESLGGGELDGTMVHSSGQVTVGVELARVELEGASLAYAVARADDGTIYVATGDAGRIYRVSGGDASAFAETGQLLVSSLIVVGDTLYAGTLPEGRIFSIRRSDGTVEELTRPEGAEHVWDLAYRDGRVYAATGPEGKVFAIDRQGRAQLYFDADATHVMSLAFDGDILYAGTSDDAVVYRVRGPGSAEVVFDFPGNEVTALDARDSMLAVAANDMPAPRTATKAKTTGGSGTPRKGKGRLWRVDSDGRAERVFSRDDGHFTSVRIG